METTETLAIVNALKSKSIPVCIIGELALNYYNVPWVIHGLELCIEECKLNDAVELLCSMDNITYAGTNKDDEVYEEHKQTFPRFYVGGNPRNKITLFTDVYMHVQPLSKTLISSGTHRGPTEFSKEILDSASAEEVSQLPIPLLPYFFIGLCRNYISLHYSYFAIHAEQVCTCMGLDEAWVQKYRRSEDKDVLDHALELARRPNTGTSTLSSMLVLSEIQDPTIRELLERPYANIPGTEVIVPISDGVWAWVTYCMKALTKTSFGKAITHLWRQVRSQ